VHIEQAGTNQLKKELNALEQTYLELQEQQLSLDLTPTGAAYPYGKDPQDANIRLAPTLPSLSEVQTTVKAFALCVKLASVRQALR
jgi:hypothetical protein